MLHGVVAVLQLKVAKTVDIVAQNAKAALVCSFCVALAHACTTLGMSWPALPDKRDVRVLYGWRVLRCVPRTVHVIPVHGENDACCYGRLGIAHIGTLSFPLLAGEDRRCWSSSSDGGEGAGG